MFYCRLQRSRQQPQRLMRIELRAAMRVAVRRRFESMDEGIETAPCRQAGGQGLRQRRIENDEIRLRFRSPDPQLLAFGASEDIRGRRFRTRAGRGRDHDLLQRILRQWIGGKRVVHRVLTGGEAACDDLADIEGRTAAYADHHVGALPDSNRRMQMSKLRLAGKVGKDLRLDARFGKRAADLGSEARLSQEGIDHEQNDMDAIERFDRCGKLGKRTLTEANVWNGGNGKGHARSPWKSD